MLNQPIGYSHIGLPSTESPYTSVDTGEQSLVIGWTHIGTVPVDNSSFIFRLTGKTIQEAFAMHLVYGLYLLPVIFTVMMKSILIHTRAFARIKITGKSGLGHISAWPVIGLLRLQLSSVISVIGISIYSNVSKYTTTGLIRLYSATIYKLTGIYQHSKIAKYSISAILRLQNTSTFLVTSISALLNINRYAVVGLARLRSITVYKITGIYQYYQSIRYYVSATLKQISVNNLLSHGHILLPATFIFISTSILRLPATARYAVTSVMRLLSINVYSINGDLANTIGNTFIKITAKLNIAALAQTVPKKVQEFLTNKRWFRYGDNGREDR